MVTEKQRCFNSCSPATGTGLCQATGMEDALQWGHSLPCVLGTPALPTLPAASWITTSSSSHSLPPPGLQFFPSLAEHSQPRRSSE